MQDDSKNLEFHHIDADMLRKSLSEKEYKKILSGKDSVDYDKLIKSKLKYENNIFYNKKMNENRSNFCDMGIMQAIDNITATMFVMNTIYSNNKIFNTKRIMLMGQSHGSYLAYLCNYMCQGLFTYILDNSAWIYPKYLNEPRGSIIDFSKNNMINDWVMYDYLAKKESIKFDFLSLEKLYSGYNNKCNIIVYHGSNDVLMPYDEKYQKFKDIPNIRFNYVEDNMVDGTIFKNTGHGLGADFIELFDLFFRENVKDEKSIELNFKNKCSINGSNLEIDYSNNLPVMYLK